MTKTGPSKPVDATFAVGRLENARAFRTAAHTASDLADPGENANPMVSHIVTSAIAYVDALTGKFGGRVNQNDHAAASKALRDALGNRLPEAQARRFKKILGEKDAAQYGARSGRLTHARQLLAELDAFAEWAETEMTR
jgi:hypothetical protein